MFVWKQSGIYCSVFLWTIVNTYDIMKLEIKIKEM